MCTWEEEHHELTRKGSEKLVVLLRSFDISSLRCMLEEDWEESELLRAKCPGTGVT